MLKLLVAGLLLSHSAPAPDTVVVGDTTAAAARELFAALAGRWSCAGAFANGRALEADLAFTPSLDGRALRYEHRDRAPSTYLQEATWGLDAASKAVVSLSFSGGGTAREASGALYVARSWTARGITLAADTLVTPPWAPNRFTYTVEGNDRIRMVWEVGRNGDWRMGDYLDCRRAPASR